MHQLQENGASRQISLVIRALSGSGRHGFECLWAKKNQGPLVSDILVLLPLGQTVVAICVQELMVWGLDVEVHNDLQAVVR